MKLLENSGIEAINNLLCLETGDSKVIGRIESYSCKMIGSEKQLYKKFSDGRSPSEVEALSPPTNGYGGYSFSTSPYSRCRTFSRSSGSEDESSGGGGGVGSGVLCDTINRKTLFYLISTLNAAFPDYDFTDAKSSEFTKEPNLQFVTSNVDNLLSVAANSLYSKIHDKLWITLNKEINLMHTDIYSYNPDLGSDPFGEEGSLWSFNYFFFNKKLKRIVLFTCRALSPFSQEFYESGYGSAENLEEMDYY